MAKIRVQAVHLLFVFALMVVVACQPVTPTHTIQPARSLPPPPTPISSSPATPTPSVEPVQSVIPPSQVIGAEHPCEASIGPARNLCLIGRTRSLINIDACLNASEHFVPICQTETAIFRKDPALCPEGQDLYSREMNAFCTIRVQAAAGNEAFCAGTRFDTPEKRKFCLAIIHNSRSSCPTSGRLGQNCLMVLGTITHAVQTCSLMGEPFGARGATTSQGDPLTLLINEWTYDANLCHAYVATYKQDPNLCNNIKPTSSAPQQRDECKSLITER